MRNATNLIIINRARVWDFPRKAVSRKSCKYFFTIINALHLHVSVTAANKRREAYSLHKQPILVNFRQWHAFNIIRGNLIFSFTFLRLHSPLFLSTHKTYPYSIYIFAKMYNVVMTMYVLLCMIFRRRHNHWNTKKNLFLFKFGLIITAI